MSKTVRAVLVGALLLALSAGMASAAFLAVSLRRSGDSFSARALSMMPWRKVTTS